MLCADEMLDSHSSASLDGTTVNCWFQGFWLNCLIRERASRWWRGSGWQTCVPPPHMTTFARLSPISNSHPFDFLTPPPRKISQWRMHAVKPQKKWQKCNCQVNASTNPFYPILQIVCCSPQPVGRVYQVLQAWQRSLRWSGQDKAWQDQSLPCSPASGTKITETACSGTR